MGFLLISHEHNYTGVMTSLQALNGGYGRKHSKVFHPFGWNRLDGPPSFTPCNQANAAVVWQDLLWPEDREVMRSHFPLRLLVFDCHLRTGLRGCHRAAFLEVTYFFHLAVTPHPTSKAVCAKFCACLVASESRPQSFHRVEAKPWSWAGPL